MNCQPLVIASASRAMENKDSPIPVIDFSEEIVKTSTTSWFSRCNHVREALEEFGCFMAIYDSVSTEIRNQVFQSLKEIFNLPTETKMKNMNSDMPYFGYIRFPELHETMGLFNATAPGAIQSFADLMWPSGNREFW